MPYKSIEDRRANARRFYERHKERLRAENREQSRRKRATHHDEILARRRAAYPVQKVQINARRRAGRKAWHASHPVTAFSPDLPGEEWRPVVGFEGWYEVSDFGRIKRVAPGPGTQVGRILKPSTPKPGPKMNYPAVTLCLNGTQARHHVHRLVAVAFIGPCPSTGHQANHIDTDHMNARADNLEWVTAPDNVRHSTQHGLTPRGVRHPQAKLREEEVREIRALRGSTTRRQLMARFGVSKSTIDHIWAGTAWRHLLDS